MCVMLTWLQVLEALYPQACAVTGQWAMGGHGAVNAGGAAGGTGGPAAGGQNTSQAGRGQGFKRGGGQGGGFGGFNKNRPSRPPAMASGLPVCYGFNALTGCKRAMNGPFACKDAKGTPYAHACNHWDGQAGRYCLANHPRVANH
jgi:hypothetical protein